MQNPFWRSAGPRFVRRDELIAIAREAARGIASRHPSVRKVILFGSVARGDFGPRSDLDLLLVLSRSDKAFRERLADFLPIDPPYPADVFPLTEAELVERISSGDVFMRRAVEEGVTVFPEGE